MNIYIDESGTFVNAASAGKWNAVAALAVTEAGWKKLNASVRRLIRNAVDPTVKEVKLNDIDEARYFEFLTDVERLNGVLFCTATDAGLNTAQQVAEHQWFQVGGVLKHIDKMKYEGGRQAVELMASQVRALSPQLYVQLMCQVNLMYIVVSRSINYYSQYTPSTLRHFRWRVDQKNTSRTNFEDAFEKISPALLQSRSISEPMVVIRGFDYSHMKAYEYPDGKPPDYLQEYGIDVGEAFNVQKLIRDDIKFMDSKESSGIQAADLLASGVRRCLRGEFENNELAALHLGKLMLQAPHNAPSLDLVTFGEEADLPRETGRLVKLMSANSRRMIK